MGAATWAVYDTAVTHPEGRITHHPCKIAREDGDYACLPRFEFEQPRGAIPFLVADCADTETSAVPWHRS